MVVSVSGIVGSGKSTVTGRIVEALTHRNVRASRARFQSLPCFTFLRPPRREEGSALSSTEAASPQRWERYARRRLTLLTAFVYGTRMLAFRMYRSLCWRRDVQVLDRYFYDLLVHYRLESPSERLLCRLLQVVMPEPDVAILLVASSESIAERRPYYSRSYVVTAGQAYAHLGRRFPELIELRTDDGQDAGETAARLVVQRLGLT